MRRARLEAPLAAEDPLRLRHFLDWLPSAPGVLATYASIPGEPGTSSLIDQLRSRGWEVWLPRLGKQVAWARFEGWGSTVAGWKGIPEPVGEAMPAERLAEADVVLASCLLVARDGHRLGVGGGWYDRALAHRRADATVLAWAREAEVADELPHEPHDVRVDGFVTERGLRFVSG